MGKVALYALPGKKVKAAWIIKEEGIGRKIRVSTNGVAILIKPKFITLIDGTT